MSIQNTNKMDHVEINYEAKQQVVGSGLFLELNVE